MVIYWVIDAHTHAAHALLAATLQTTDPQFV